MINNGFHFTIHTTRTKTFGDFVENECVLVSMSLYRIRVVCSRLMTKYYTHVLHQFYDKWGGLLGKM